MDNWIIQNPQGTAYILQEAYSSLVYANNGEPVYALDGSPIRAGSLWANQLDKNSAWISQTEGS